MTRLISYTVEQALRLPCLSSARIVAGSDGVGRPVEAVGVLDVTDFHGVQRHQLVLSNAYPLIEMDLEVLVEQLTRSNAAGLAVSLSDYWSEVPRTLIRAADAASFPILVLPEGPFDEVVNPVLTAIAGHQLEALRQSMAVHDQLTRAALREEGDPNSVAQILGQALRRPTAIFTERGELVAFTGDDEGWGSEELIGFVVRGASGGVVQAGGVGYYLASAPARGTPRAIVCVRDIDPTDTLSRSAITHAAVVAGMILVGRREVEEVYRKYERELFEDLTERRPVQPDDARSRASRIGWPLQRPYLVMAVGSTSVGKGSGSAERDAHGDSDLATLSTILRDSGFDGRFFLWPPGVGLVIHLRPGDNPVGVADSIATSLRESTESPWRHHDVVVGVGRPRRDVTALAEAFREAKLAFRFYRQIHPRNVTVTHFTDLGAIGLMSLTRNPKRMLDVAHKILGPLADPNLVRRKDLLLTLHTLLARNMNLRVAADELFFHYNTVRHRVSRLRTLLGDTLDDPEQRLMLSLAVDTLQLYEDQAPVTSLRPDG